jgi:hypothetical protein
MLAVALHLREQNLSLRDIAARLVIATGKKKGQHPSPSTVLRMLREHDEKAAAAAVPGGRLTARAPGSRRNSPQPERDHQPWPSANFRSYTPRGPRSTCARSPTAPACPYRRAAEIFEQSTRRLARPNAPQASSPSSAPGRSISSGTASSPTRPNPAPTPRRCWPAPGTPPCAAWSATPGRDRKPSRGTWPPTTQPHDVGKPDSFALARAKDQLSGGWCSVR